MLLFGCLTYSKRLLCGKQLVRIPSSTSMRLVIGGFKCVTIWLAVIESVAVVQPVASPRTST